MAKLDVNVSVSKETYELGQGLAKFVGVVKDAVADGWQTGDDLPDVVASAVSDLIPAVQGVSDIGDELKEDKAAMVRAVSLSIAEIVGKF